MKHIHLRVVLVLIAWVGVAQAQSTSTPTAAPTTAPGRVLLVTIDGLRPDLALLADMPSLRGLMRTGAYTMWARTTDVAITLPSHATLVTGVAPKVHGITFNNDEDPAAKDGPKVPTIFELAKSAGLSTALVSGKAKFSVLVKPGAVDSIWLPGEAPFDDLTIADEAAKIIKASKPQMMMVHFSRVDAVGHGPGWGTKEHLAAIGMADQGLGRVLAALEAAGVRDQTLVLLCADHGGSGKAHGGTRGSNRAATTQSKSVKVPDYASLTIPWVAAGPGVRAGYDLTLNRELDVRIEDGFATACQVLGITLPEQCEGRVVREIWAEGKAPRPQVAPR